jgi:RNA polymerase sigma-70 factor (ECF subfamily)
VKVEMAPDPLRELAEVAQRERRGLLGVATRQGLSAEEALECVQDALCRWLARRERGAASDGEYLAATLKLMVKNAARNWRRRHARLKVHTELEAEIDLATPVADAERLLDAAEESLRLQTCVASLRDVERAVVTLRLLEERSGEDVAHALGLSRAHIDVIVHRAKATLRTCMGAPNCVSGA